MLSVIFSKISSEFLQRVTVNGHFCVMQVRAGNCLIFVCVSKDLITYIILCILTHVYF